MPSVSLCVPTYNRAGKLCGMLRRLFDAIANSNYAKDFEVCISDNASTDDTPKIVDQFERQGLVEVRRIRQPANLGFAGNFSAVARLATGRSFVILADDDELEPDALEAMIHGAQRLTANRPLVLFNSLPGGDAVYREMQLPTVDTDIAGPHELLAKLGIFHASFVSNLLFRREVALSRWPHGCERSRYPHMILALTLLKEYPATYIPRKLVSVQLPPDAGDQPMLTSVDMARVQTDYALSDPRCRGQIWWVYSFLLRMLPTAIYQQRTGACVAVTENPFSSLQLRNVCQCYRHSHRARIIATVVWFASNYAPKWWLRVTLRTFSRHAR